MTRDIGGKRGTPPPDAFTPAQDNTAQAPDSAAAPALVEPAVVGGIGVDDPELTLSQAHARMRAVAAKVQFTSGDSLPSPASLSGRPHGASMRPTMPTREACSDDQLERLAAQRCVMAAGAGITRCGRGVLVVVPSSGRLTVRAAVLLSMTGGNPEVSSAIVSSPALEGSESWLHVSGVEQVVLEAPNRLALDSATLRQQELVVRGSSLVAFEGLLQCQPEWLPALPSSTWFRCRGDGSAIMQLQGELRSLQVLPGRVTTVRESDLVGWWGRLAVRIGPVTSGSTMLEFRGQGALFVDMDEEEAR